MHWTSNTWNNDSLLQFSFQGCDISPLLENNNPREGFQAGCSEERAGESHQEDGKVVTLDANWTVTSVRVGIKKEHWKNCLFFRFLKTSGVIRRMDLTSILPMSQAGVCMLYEFKKICMSGKYILR